jgi:hypothetical protein
MLKQLPAKAPVKGQASVVLTNDGLTHKNTLERLKNGLKTAPDTRLIVEDEHCLWGGERWTSDDLKAVLVQMVSEGMSLRNALEALRESAPPMPSCLTVYRWLSVDPEFKKAYLIAQKLRGEMLVESANELVVQALGDSSLDPRTVKNAVEQFRWSASKLDRDTYGDHRTVEVQQPMAGLSDKDLDRRITALMVDPQVRGVLNSQGFEVLDVEVIEDISPSSEPAIQG